MSSSNSLSNHISFIDLDSVNPSQPFLSDSFFLRQSLSSNEEHGSHRLNHSAPIVEQNKDFMLPLFVYANNLTDLEESSYTVPTSENLIINLSQERRPSSSEPSTNITNADRSTAPYTDYLSPSSENYLTSHLSPFLSTQTRNHSIEIDSSALNGGRTEGCRQENALDQEEKLNTSFRSQGNRQQNKKAERRAFRQLMGLDENNLDVAKVQRLMIAILPQNEAQLDRLPSQTLLQVYRQWRRSTDQHEPIGSHSQTTARAQFQTIGQSASQSPQHPPSSQRKQKDTFISSLFVSPSAQQRQQIANTPIISIAKADINVYIDPTTNVPINQNANIKQIQKRDPRVQDYRTVQRLLGLEQGELKRRLVMLYPEAVQNIKANDAQSLKSMLKQVLQTMLDPVALDANFFALQNSKSTFSYTERDAVSTLLIKNALTLKFPQIKKEIAQMTQADIHDVYLDTLSKQQQIISSFQLSCSHSQSAVGNKTNNQSSSNNNRVRVQATNIQIKKQQKTMKRHNYEKKISEYLLQNKQINEKQKNNMIKNTKQKLKIDKNQKERMKKKIETTEENDECQYVESKHSREKRKQIIKSETEENEQKQTLKKQNEAVEEWERKNAFSIKDIKKQLCRQLPNMKQQILQMSAKEIQNIYLQSMGIKEKLPQKVSEKKDQLSQDQKISIEEIFVNADKFKEKIYYRKHNIQVFESERLKNTKKKTHVLIIARTEEEEQQLKQKEKLQLQQCQCVCCSNSPIPKQLKQILQNMIS